jgi:glycerol kinase
MRYILALDQGTTSSRALLFDRGGNVVATAQRELTQFYPTPGWVEQEADEIWRAQLDVARDAMQLAGANVSDVAAIGIANQRETTIVWDRTSGAPIHRAIVWQDRRTASVCDQLEADDFGPLILERTGLVVDAYFSGTKVQWILDHVPGARRRAEAGELAFGTVDSWLLWKLTGGSAHLTDASNASRTLLYNIHTGVWDDHLLDILRVPRQLLPNIAPSSGVVAQTDPGVFGARIPIAGIAGDQQAALFGQRCVHPGMVKNTYGTGCFLLMHTGEQPVHSRSKLLATVAWQKAGRREFALEGSVFVAGAAVQWLRDGLGLIQSAADIEKLAAQAPDNGGVYLVPAFTGLGAPHWDPYARGAIFGLTRGTTASNLARATLESIAYQTADVLAAMQADSGIVLKELRVDGGATRNDLLMQFQSDILGVRVVRPRQSESTALGAAFLAGLGVGFWQTEAEIDAQWDAQRVFEPNMEADTRQRLLAGWGKALDRAKEWDK